MVWARLDDAILDNPKIARAGVLGFAYHVAAITWCCRNLTDGFLPYQRLRSLLDISDLDVEYLEATTSPEAMHASFFDAIREVGEAQADKIAGRLVEVGLWREDQAKGGYWLHDFLEFNPSREEAKAKSEARAEAGKRGADSRWGTKPPTRAPHGKPDGKPMASAMANPMANPWQADGKPMAKVCPDPDPDPDPDPQISPREDLGSGSTLQVGSAPPPWWAAACDATAMVLGGEVADRLAFWVRYLASRKRKVWSMDHTDAVGWLTDVIGRERREANDRRDRDAGFKAERGALGPKAPKAEDSTKTFRERDDWAKTAGPPDPATAERLRKLMGGVGR